VPVQSKKEEILAYLTPFISKKNGNETTRNEQTETTQHGISVIRKALTKGASDLYIEPSENDITIQMRIDGILYKAKPLPKICRGY